MGVEAACSECKGRFIVETPGVLVACPHCGAHTMVSGEAVRSEPPQFDSARPFDAGPRAGSSVIRALSALTESTAATDVKASIDIRPSQDVADATTSQPPSVEAEKPGEAIASVSSDASEELVGAGVREREPAAQAAATTPRALAVKAAPPRRGVPTVVFVAVLSYASAATIACGYLYWLTQTAKPHQLESLPDLEPPKNEDGQIAFRRIDETAAMPPGHVLELGTSRRFGNIVVTPLRVTRGPLQFVHYTGGRYGERKPTSPVLKLWLRFENVSKDQTIAPLDKKLLLTRVPAKDGSDELKANQFVVSAADKSRPGNRVLVYDIPMTGEWDLASQHLGRELKPGESVETYIATTEEGLERLAGDVLWRIQFRKGYHPQSKLGVTTLIEVAFSSDRIRNETAG